MIPQTWQIRDRDTLAVIQISDCHLFADTDLELKGWNPYRNLQMILDEIAVWQPDMVIASGDLTHDEQAETYRLLRNQLQRLNCPVYTLPGNHDVPALMHQHLCGGNVFYQPHAILGAWQFAFLDTVVAGEEYGEVATDQIVRLKQRVLKEPNRPLLVALHHPPITIDSPWMDRIGLRNSDVLLQELSQLQPIRAVTFGHIHQEIERKMGDFMLYSTPSTALQFLPHSLTSQIDPEGQPGFRWFLLDRSGGVSSEIHRVNLQ